MSGLAKSFVAAVASFLVGVFLTTIAMREWLVSVFLSNPLNTVFSYAAAAAFGACASWALNEWRLGRTPLGRRLDAERDRNRELRRQLAAASGGRTPDERDEEIERLNDRLSSLQQAHSFLLQKESRESFRERDARRRARSMFSRLTHEDAALVYEIFSGSPILATADNAATVASAYRAGAVENLNSQHKEPLPGCFVRVRNEWTRMLNEYEADFREIHGL